MRAINEVTIRDSWTDKFDEFKEWLARETDSDNRRVLRKFMDQLDHIEEWRANHKKKMEKLKAEDPETYEFVTAVANKDADKLTAQLEAED